MKMSSNIRSPKNLEVPALLLVNKLLDGSAQAVSYEVVDIRDWEDRQNLLEDDDRVVDMHELSRLNRLHQALRQRQSTSTRREKEESSPCQACDATCARLAYSHSKRSGLPERLCHG